MTTSTLAVARRPSGIVAFGIVGFAVVLALASQIAVPIPGTPVPITLQPLVVVLAGMWLGPVAGAASMILYLVAGAAGLPVFSPFGAPGLARFVGPTGGYLFAYPVAAFVAGALSRRARSLLPDISELFTGFPSPAALRSIVDNHLIRLEDEVEDGRYVVRAEIPGVDPAKDVDITVRDGRLTIKAERSERTEEGVQWISSERFTGTYLRQLSLGDGIDAEGISATYANGVLTVSLPVAERAKPRKVTVTGLSSSEDHAALES